MTIIILPLRATAQEVEEMMQVMKKSFGPDPLIDFCFYRPDVPQESKEKTFNDHLDRLADPRWTFYKAVDSEDLHGSILGVSAWFFETDPHAARVNGPWGDAPPGKGFDCYDASVGALKRWRYDYFVEHDEPFVHMALLAVLPGMQRSGVGSALLREGLKEFDRRNLRSFIQASPAGAGLYKKFGWQEMLKTVVNLKDYGGPDIDCVTIGLLREVNAKEIVKAAV